jgi:hypothetical protein
MLFTDDTKTYIIGILGSLIAKAFYDVFSYVWQYSLDDRSKASEPPDKPGHLLHMIGI